MYGDLSTVRFVRDGTAARDAAKPRTGARVGRQSFGYRSRVWPGSASCGDACGVVSTETAATLADCAWPYWRMLLWGCEPVYRLMRNQPTLALARYIVTGPILASSWDVTWDDNIDKGDPAIQWVKDNVLPLRRRVMRDAVRAVEFGWQPFALEWLVRDGKLAFAPSALLPDATQVIKDGNKFAGVENTAEDGKKTTFNDLESWAPALDGEAGYPYGRSRFENVRDTAWADWLQTMLEVRALERKIAGIVPIVTHPPGGYTDDDGNAVNFATEADTILAELPKGRGVRVEAALDVGQLLDNPEFAAELAKLKLFDVQFLDAGNVSQAVVGFVSKLEYLDKLLFRGMLRGERAGLEAVAAGSRADSETHSSAGAADSEAIDADLTESFQDGPVANALRLNFGETQARGIRVISTPLQEWKKQVFRELLTRLVSIPQLAVDVARSLDMPAIFTQMSLPQLRDFVVSAVVPPAGGTPPGNNGDMPPGKMNGNGKMNGDKQAQAEHLADLLHARFSPQP